MCSSTCIPFGNAKGLIFSMVIKLGLVPYTCTSFIWPNTFLYSPLAGSITINCLPACINECSNIYTVFDFPQPVEPVTKVCEARELMPRSTVFVGLTLSRLIIQPNRNVSEFLRSATTLCPNVACSRTKRPGTDFRGRPIMSAISLLLFMDVERSTTSRCPPS